MKVPVLVVVRGGCAETHGSEHSDARIVDLDDLEAGGGSIILPRDCGFEALTKGAGLEESVHFEWEAK